MLDAWHMLLADWMFRKYTLSLLLRLSLANITYCRNREFEELIVIEYLHFISASDPIQYSAILDC